MLRDAHIEDLSETFDRLDTAIQRVLVAKPWQMSEAAVALQQQRVTSRETVQRILTDAGRAALCQSAGGDQG